MRSCDTRAGRCRATARQGRDCKIQDGNVWSGLLAFCMWWRDFVYVCQCAWYSVTLSLSLSQTFEHTDSLSHTQTLDQPRTSPHQTRLRIFANRAGFDTENVFNTSSFTNKNSQTNVSSCAKESNDLLINWNLTRAKRCVCVCVCVCSCTSDDYSS
jgi:hypothetical protein